MTEVRDWRRNRDLWTRLLEKQTGAGLAAWNRMIRGQHFDNERQLRSWLSRQHVTGHARQHTRRMAGRALRRSSRSRFRLTRHAAVGSELADVEPPHVETVDSQCAHVSAPQSQ
jgi:hypothetical protein